MNKVKSKLKKSKLAKAKSLSEHTSKTTKLNKLNKPGKPINAASSVKDLPKKPSQAATFALTPSLPRVPNSLPAQHHKQTASAPLPKPKYIDLFPWPFEKTRKALILREEWNGLVKQIQAAGSKELEAENTDLHNQIARLLNDVESMRAKYQEMAKFVASFNREFTSKFN